MGIRCELCDDILPFFQLSRLCPCCYKIRTIVKCYNSSAILDCLEKTFKVNYEMETKVANTDSPVSSEEEDEGKCENKNEEKVKTRSQSKKDKTDEKKN